MTAPVDLFGFKFNQSERLRFGGELMVGWSHDGAQAALGFEKQGRVGMAILSLSGRVSDRVRYFVSFNPVNEMASRPACGEKDFFFPNDPNLFAGTGPIVQVRRRGRPQARRYLQHVLARLHHPAGHPARGLRRLSASPTTCRCAAAASSCRSGSRRAKSARPAPRTWRASRGSTPKPTSARCSPSRRRNARSARCSTPAVMAVLGDGNREKDYDWFYFVNTSLDTNSAITVAASARIAPITRARAARRLQEGLYRLEGRAAAELLGLEAK